MTDFPPIDTILRMDTLLLASSSPRRKEILRDLGIGFESIAPDTDESLHDDEAPPQRVLAIARDKARAALVQPAAEAHRLILAADTLVALPSGPHGREEVLGKPATRAEARAMLSLLAGREHFVHTGLYLLDRLSGSAFEARSDSRVSFAPMTEREIEDYLDTEEWRGVAGAYRIQGRAAFYIDDIEGSWSGIVGLPIRELYGILSRSGWDFRKSGVRAADAP